MIIDNLAEFASKRFGQNFLKDHRYIDRIIEAMPDDSLPIAEIGPGLGDLTASLLATRQHVTAFEVDKRLCVLLEKHFEKERDAGRFELHCGDVLAHEEGLVPLKEPYRLVSNLPYYIATRIILKALRDERCQEIIVMVQKEVAEKFAAHSGERSFSALSVLAESCGKATLLFEVPPEAFVPAPKVTSAVLQIEKRHHLHDRGFEDFLKTAFTQPRKTLLKNLSARFEKSKVEMIFETLTLSTKLRPHQVETMQYQTLYRLLKGEGFYGRESTTETADTDKKQRNKNRT